MPNDSISSATLRTPYPLDADRVDEYLDDKRVIGVCPLSSSLSTAMSSSSSLSSSSSTPTLSTASSSLFSTPNSFSLSLSPSYYPSSTHAYDTDSSCQYDPLIQPALIKHEIVTTQNSRQTIAKGRFEASRIIAGQDDRVLVIVGPCSIHSPEQAIDYARRLKEKIPTWPNLMIVMRSYLYVHFTTPNHYSIIYALYLRCKCMRVVCFYVGPQPHIANPLPPFVHSASTSIVTSFFFFL